MTQQPYNDDQLILAARLYFLDGLPQARIGQLVNVSQSKVSRMLALAKERGLVRITVPDYNSRCEELEERLRERFGIEAVVIRVVSGLKADELRHTIGYFAAPIVSEWIGEARTIAVSGGRTMQALVEQFKAAQPRPDLVVAQAMGNIDPSPGPFDATELGRTIAKRWGGTFLTLSTPAILPDAETCRRFLEIEPIQNVLNCLERADLALVGVGTLSNSVFLDRRILGAGELALLGDAGAVGEMLGRYFDRNGKECETRFRQRVVSLGLDALRRIPRRAGVVAGADRAQAVRSAIEGGLLNALVTDERGATALLEEA